MSDLANGRRASLAVHKSIAALLDAHPGKTDPEALIRQLARDKVAYAKRNRWSGPPFCPKELTSIFGIRCKEVDHDIGGDGRILTFPDGKPRIEYRSKRLIERQRFTIFHEFAHTLFPDFCDFLQFNHSPGKSAPDPEKKFEYLCDLGAAEMLFPLEDFNSDLQPMKWFGFEAIHLLRQRYLASIDATVYRLMELAKGVACAAVFLTDQQGTSSGRGPLWVNNTKPNALFKGFIRPGTPIPATSIAVHCYQKNIATTEPVKETWWLNGSPRTWLVQAAKLPVIIENPNYSKVVVLLLPSGHLNNWAGRTS